MIIMLVDEARKQKQYEFNQVQNNINDLITECEGMYTFLLKYNDIITYEELYTLSEEDNDEFIRIRDRTHEVEHLLVHCREDLMALIDGDIEWFLIDDTSSSDGDYFADYLDSDVFFNCFRLEVVISLLFDKLKQLNVPRKHESHFHLYSHHGGGCC